MQDHFRSSDFTYSERPPSRRYPLNAFLFQDKIGYCQQFSGAMALMLRMAGIPARVATGFSPGSLNRDTGEYRVRDLDAHSWVEVYFNDIGWVTFDPTPPASPADRAGQGPRAAPDAEEQPRDALSGDGDSPLSDRAADTGAAGRGGGGGGGGGPPAGVLAGLALPRPSAAAATCWRAGGCARTARAEAGLAELERALPRLGWKLPAGHHAAPARAAPAPRRRAGVGAATWASCAALRFGAGPGAPPPARRPARGAARADRGRRSAGAPARIHGSAAAPAATG